MMRTNFLSLLLAVLLSAAPALLHGQQPAPILGLEQAIGQALQQNHDIRLATLNQQVQQNNAQAGNAGLLPSVTVGGGASYSNQNTRLEFAGDAQPPLDVTGASTISVDGDVTVNYLLFNGGTRMNTYSQLQTQSQLALLQQQQTIETVVQNTSVAYYNLVQQYDALRINQRLINLSAERFTRVQERYKLGSATRLEVLNAEVDLRNDSINYEQTQQALENARKDFAVLIGWQPDTLFVPDTTVTLASPMDLQSLEAETLARNLRLAVARANQLNSNFALKSSKGALFPSLNLSGGYGVNQNISEANFLELQRSMGWNAQLRISYTLYNGGVIQRQIQNAQLNVQSQEVALEQTQNQVERDLLNNYNTYQTSRRLLGISQRNMELAQLNYARSQEAFATGSITGVELRTALVNLVTAQNNVSRQRIATKVAEINLQAVAGLLVQRQ